MSSLSYSMYLQMSLVGPRPGFVERFGDKIPINMLRQEIKAGMAGRAQRKAGEDIPPSGNGSNMSPTISGRGRLFLT
jgi:lipopolysaccharide/colanic/teichoic acid biosynthesis glycosyltransferase